MHTTTVIVGIVATHLACFSLLALLIHLREPQPTGIREVGLALGLLSASYVLQLTGGPPGWSWSSVVNHSLAVTSTALLLVGLLRFMDLRVPGLRTLLAGALLYTALQVAVQRMLGSEGRYALLHLSNSLCFAAMVFGVWRGYLDSMRDLRWELGCMAAAAAGFCILHAVKFLRVLQYGLPGLDAASTFQTVFYGYVSIMAVMIPPMIMWMIFKRLTAQLQSAAIRDPLTQTLNRRGMLQRVQQHLADRRVQGIVLMMLDIDRFKAINDTHGHLVGDEMLRRLAQEVQQQLRGEDFVARAGGEEFIVGCIDADEHAAQQLAERLRAHIAATDLVRKEDGTALRCTVTIGVSRKFRHESELETALKAADDALYVGKRSGRNRVISSAPGDAGIARA